MSDGRYDENGVYTPPKFGADPVNLTNIEIPCNLGHVENLIGLGLSTWDSICPKSDYDDVYDYKKIFEDISLDNECSYHTLDKNSSEFQAINEEFRKVRDNPYSGLF